MLLAAKSKTTIQYSNYKTYPIDNIIYNHYDIDLLIQNLLKNILLLFEPLNNKKLGTYNREQLHFRLKKNTHLRYQTLYLIHMKHLPLTYIACI